MAKVELEQGSEEWLRFRKDKIGASDAPIIMGVSKWKTPYQLYEEKMSDELHSTSNAAIERGKALEANARKCYERLKQKSFLPYVGTRFDYPFLIASMDGLSLDRKEGLEIKCSGLVDHTTASTGKVPVHYFPQLQHQMFVCDLPSIDYFSYVTDDIHVTLTVARDDEYISSMLQKELAFYKCMQTRTPPPLCDRDYLERNDSEWALAVDEWKCAKFGLKISEEIMDKARDRLIKICDRSCKGNGIYIEKGLRKGQVDYSKIEALKDVDLTPYRKESSIVYTIREEKSS